MDNLFNFEIDTEYSALVITSEILDFLTILLIDSDIEVFDTRKEYIDDYDDISQENMLQLINQLQKLNKSLIEIGMDYNTRKEKLEIRYAQLVAKLLDKIA